MQRIHVSLDKCTGCRICEMACSAKNSGEFGTSVSLIKTVRTGLPELTTVNVCQQCEQPACLDNCPVGAISKNEQGIVEVDDSSCTGCGSCVDACSYDAIFLQADVARKCELCNGDPECVTCCPSGALSVVDWVDEENGPIVKQKLLNRLFGKDTTLTPDQWLIK